MNTQQIREIFPPANGSPEFKFANSSFTLEVSQVSSEIRIGPANDPVTWDPDAGHIQLKLGRAVSFDNFAYLVVSFEFWPYKGGLQSPAPEKTCVVQAEFEAQEGRRDIDVLPEVRWQRTRPHVPYAALSGALGCLLGFEGDAVRAASWDSVHPDDRPSRRNDKAPSGQPPLESTRWFKPRYSTTAPEPKTQSIKSLVIGMCVFMTVWLGFVWKDPLFGSEGLSSGMWFNVVLTVFAGLVGFGTIQHFKKRNAILSGGRRTPGLTYTTVVEAKGDTPKHDAFAYRFIDHLGQSRHSKTPTAYGAQLPKEALDGQWIWIAYTADNPAENLPMVPVVFAPADEELETRLS